MGKCWTFAGVNNQALKALRAVYKAEENKAVRVRGCTCVRVVLFCVERLVWLGGRRSFPFRSLYGLPVGVHPHRKPPTQPPPSKKVMILLDSLLLALLSVVCVVEISVFSHRFRTVLTTLGAINQVRGGRGVLA